LAFIPKYTGKALYRKFTSKVGTVKNSFLNSHLDIHVELVRKQPTFVTVPTFEDHPTLVEKTEYSETTYRNSTKTVTYVNLHISYVVSGEAANHCSDAVG